MEIGNWRLAKSDAQHGAVAYIHEFDRVRRDLDDPELSGHLLAFLCEDDTRIRIEDSGPLFLTVNHVCGNSVER